MKCTITKNRQKPKWLLLLLLILLTQAYANAQQSIVVSGKVKDETGETLPGVNVRIKGTQTGTATDANGAYVLRVPDTRSTLEFTYVGYKPLEMPVNGQVTINITMTADARSLNDVVVIGYGTQKRETVTGAITTIKAEDFVKGNIVDPITLIEGKVAGLAVSKTGGSDPNAMADFQLRGPNTVQGYSQPLLVIDGVPGGDMEMIAPADIASIDVLKDASAAAIYGSRATGGVIIITTKKGQAGTSTITYDGNLSTDVISHRLDVLDKAQYVALGQKYGLKTNGQGANTNWLDAITRTPVSHSHNLAINGGTDKTTYYAGVDYKNLQGIDLSDRREYVEGTASVTTKAMNDKLTFSVRITNSFDNRFYSNTSAMAQTLNMNPTYPIYNPDGSFFEKPGDYNLEWNPVAEEKQNINNDEEKRLLGVANVSYNIVSTLKANVNYSTTREDYIGGSYTDNNDFFQDYPGTAASSNLLGEASRSTDNSVDNVLETTLNYTKQIKKNSFDFIAGYSYENDFDEQFGMGNNNFPTNAFLYYNLGAGQALNDLTPGDDRGGVYEYGSASQRTLIAFFGRMIYNYDEKYLLNLSIRHEGASVLGADHKWGTFFGASAGWIISKEDFLANNDVVKFLKLRGGYGSTGNQSSLAPYQSLALLGAFTSVDGETGNTDQQDGYVGTPNSGTWIVPYGPTINANPQLQWETQDETDIGLDFSLFNSSWLTGTFDYYNRRIHNLVGNYSAQVPSNIFSTIFANAGEMTNVGEELALNASLVKKANFTWNANFTSSYNKNDIVSITSDQFHGSAQDYTNIDGNFIQRLAPGEPEAEFYGPIFAGFAKDGSWLFKNAAGQAVPETSIDPSTDYKYLGNGIPKYNLSLTNTFRFKNFDLSFMLRSALGFKAVNVKRIFHENLSEYSESNLFTTVINNPSQLVHADEPFSSYYIENGNYMKLDNLNIGYTIPLGPTSAIKHLRVSLIAQNLLTITKYSGSDPELPLTFNTNQDPNTFNANPGVESNYTYYPATTTFTLSLSATF